MDNSNRFGKFTSSEIYNLIKKGKSNPFTVAGLSYIQEKKYERQLQRSISCETSARALEWGKTCEIIAFEKLGLEYKIQSDESITHPDYPFWSGSPDCIKFGKTKVVPEIKCPYTLLSFCNAVEMGSKGIEYFRDNYQFGEKYYWQVVSNCAILGINTGELIIYMPYKKDLEAIKEKSIYNWITYAKDEDLPYLNDTGFYNDLYIFQFDIPKSDIDLLTQRVIEANN